MADVQGYFVADPNGAQLTELTPLRVLDTRNAIGVPSTTPLAAGATLTLSLRGALPRLPATVRAVVLNLTVTSTTRAGNAAIWAGVPSGTSAVNWTGRGQSVSSLVVVPVDSSGQVDVSVNSTAHVVGDVLGYFG